MLNSACLLRSRGVTGRVGEYDPTREQCLFRLSRQRRFGAPGIFQKLFDLAGLGLIRTVNIAPERCLEAVFASLSRGRALLGVESRVIGGGTAEKGPRHRFDALAHGEVSDAHLAQVHIHIVHHDLEHQIGQALARLSRRTQRAKDEKHMQHDQIEPAVQTVGHAAVGIKAGPARLLDGRNIEGTRLVTLLSAPLGMAQQTAQQFHLVFVSTVLTVPCAVRIFSPRYPYTAQAAQTRYNIPTMMKFVNNRRFGPRRSGPVAAIAVVAALVVAGCAPEINTRGHVPDPESLEFIKPGQQTRDQVLDMLGSPTAIGTFEDTRWYYITRKTEQLAFYDPELIEAQVIVVEFDTAGFVKQVAHLSNDEMRDIDPVDRTTPTKGRKLGFFRQILGNLGVSVPQ